MSERNIFEGIGETVEFEMENTDALKELFNKTKEENLKIQKRFADGTYTEDDLLNRLPRFGLGTKDKIEMYVVESKYFEDLANRYTNLKEIEQAHKTDNGLLRQELDMQIEHNKELEATLKQTQSSWFEDTQKLEQEKEKNKELEKQINFNKKTVEIAQTQILEYSQGYKDGLNKETTATAIVARELELNFIRQEIKHKYISKDKIREKIRMYKLVGNSVSARTLELLLEEN